MTGLCNPQKRLAVHKLSKYEPQTLNNRKSWGFLKWGYPEIIHFNRIFPLKKTYFMTCGTVRFGLSIRELRRHRGEFSQRSLRSKMTSLDHFGSFWAKWGVNSTKMTCYRTHSAIQIIQCPTFMSWTFGDWWFRGIFHVQKRIDHPKAVHFIIFHHISWT